MFEVELDVFSGRANPRWELTKSEGRDLLQRIRDGVATPLPVNHSDGRLGYRGFVVRATDEDGLGLADAGKPVLFRLREGLVGGMGESEENLLATRLDSTLSAEESSVVSEEVISEIQAPSSAQAIASAAAACSLLYTSWNDFTFWNGARMPDNNCYNYAANYASNTFAQPGRQGGSVFSALTVANIKAAMRRDGWVDDCNTGNLRVALVIWPGMDYHFYRKNLNGSGADRWCHKPGRTPARNTDNSGNYITSAQNCNRGSYTTWGGPMFSNGVRARTVR